MGRDGRSFMAWFGLTTRLVVHRNIYILPFFLYFSFPCPFALLCLLLFICHLANGVHVHIHVSMPTLAANAMHAPIICCSSSSRT